MRARTWWSSSGRPPRGLFRGGSLRCGPPTPSDYDLKANWKLVVQNFSECLHCPVIHPQLQRFSHYLSGENYPVTPGAIGSAMDLADGIETLSTDGKLVGEPLPELSAADRRLVAYDILVAERDSSACIRTTWCAT